jgi:CheY-like chemotaxis protein
MAFRASVLVVDDDPATLVALPDMLTTRIPGVSVTTYESAITGLEALRTSNYDAVVVDLRMPEMDGLTLLRNVRQFSEHTPVVIISGRVNGAWRSVWQRQGRLRTFRSLLNEWNSLRPLASLYSVV